MTPERWQKIKAILHSALEMNEEKRGSYLERECRDDEKLRREVEELIADRGEAEERFESPAVELLAKSVLSGAHPDLSGQTLGSYRIEKKLGSGGMGDVYLARDSRLDRKVALKVLPRSASPTDQSAQRFVQEARSASALNHANIITIYEVAEAGDVSYIAMEYVEGETLRDVISRGRPDVRRAVEYVAQAAAGLAAAHEAGIVHRDIKPENLMVTPAGQVKILDFGLAKLVEARRTSMLDSSNSTLDLGNAAEAVKTTPGMIMGTVAYMSPEQAEGRPVDRRTDIFSLGVVLYELVCSARPFEGNSVIDTLHAIINTEPVPVRERNSSLPLEIDEIIGKALAKDAAERYQHAGDFELDLRRFKRALESGSLLSSRVNALTTVQTVPARRRTMSWALGAVVLIIAAIGISWMFRPAKTAPTAPQPVLKAVSLTPITVDSGFEGEPSFAPDGQTIAYVSDRSGNFEIFLRQIAGGPDINLTNNPSDDMQPSVSPDGKQIAFISARTGESDCLCFFVYGTDQPLMGGSVWVMPVLGGSPRKIADNGTFPSWSPDGSAIVFTRGSWFGQKIYRVSPNGGTPQDIPVNFKEPAPFIAYPSFSYDGQLLVFEAANKIYVVSSAGGDPYFVADGKHPVWGADARSIIYTNVDAGKNYALWEISLNESRTAAGTAAPLTIGRGRDTQATVSKDGNYIAFAALDVSFNLESIPFDAESPKPSLAAKPITSGSDLIYFFSTSQDGASATFDSHRGASSFIWKVAEERPSVQLTGDSNFEDFYPRTSPDGTRVAFNRKKANDPEAVESVWLMESDGANPRVLIEQAGFVGWFGDSRRLAYTSFSDGQVYVLDLSSREARKLTEEKGIFGGPVISSDGQWAAYMTIAAGNIDIRAVPVSGGPSIEVISTPRQDFHPTFSPSGRWLYFQLDHKNLYRVPGPAQEWRKAPPEKATNFAESGLFLEDPQISGDGRRLIYSRRRTAGDIWLMKIGK